MRNALCVISSPLASLISRRHQWKTPDSPYQQPDTHRLERNRVCLKRQNKSKDSPSPYSQGKNAMETFGHGKLNTINRIAKAFGKTLEITLQDAP